MSVPARPSLLPILRNVDFFFFFFKLIQVVINHISISLCCQPEAFWIKRSNSIVRWTRPERCKTSETNTKFQRLATKSHHYIFSTHNGWMRTDWFGWGDPCVHCFWWGVILIIKIHTLGGFLHFYGINQSIFNQFQSKLFLGALQNPRYSLSWPLRDREKLP